MDVLSVNPTNIWNYKQNHPELVIKDLESIGVSQFIVKFVRVSMLARGINKWLKVRRDLIAYKKQIRSDIKSLQKSVPELKQQMTKSWVNFNTASTYEVSKYYQNRELYLITKEKLKLLEKVRLDLKNLCMTDRWQIWKDKKLEEMNSITASDN